MFVYKNNIWVWQKRIQKCKIPSQEIDFWSVLSTGVLIRIYAVDMYKLLKSNHKIQVIDQIHAAIEPVLVLMVDISLGCLEISLTYCTAQNIVVTFDQLIRCCG